MNKMSYLKQKITQIDSITSDLQVQNLKVYLNWRYKHSLDIKVVDREIQHQIKKVQLQVIVLSKIKPLNNLNF